MKSFAAICSFLAVGAVAYAAPYTFNDSVQITTNNNPLLYGSGTGGVVFWGTMGLGAIPATGGGTRLMWYPKKAAFRVGYVDGGLWDDANVGDFSMGVGGNSTASGFSAVALGSSTATGHQSVSAGWGSTASGEFAVAMGIGTASGTYSFAVGQSTASGYQSTALGGGNAIGDHSNAIGWNATAVANFSTVVGVFNELIGNPTMNLPSNPVFVVGNGTDNTNRSNAFEVHMDGTILMAPQGDISMGEFAP